MPRSIRFVLQNHGESRCLICIPHSDPTSEVETRGFESALGYSASYRWLGRVYVCLFGCTYFRKGPVVSGRATIGSPTKGFNLMGSSEDLSMPDTGLTGILDWTDEVGGVGVCAIIGGWMSSLTYIG